MSELHDEIVGKYAEQLGHLQFGLQVSDAWLPIIDTLMSELLSLPEGCPPILQVKEKFAELRFYTEGKLTYAQKMVIEAAEVQAAATCEICGQHGQRRTVGPLVVLCEDHYARRIRERRRFKRKAKQDRRRLLASPDERECL